jgi:hypothetical protein
VGLLGARSGLNRSLEVPEKGGKGGIWEIGLAPISHRLRPPK